MTAPPPAAARGVRRARREGVERVRRVRAVGDGRRQVRTLLGGARRDEGRKAGGGGMVKPKMRGDRGARREEVVNSEMVRRDEGESHTVAVKSRDVAANRRWTLADQVVVGEAGRWRQMVAKCGPRAPVSSNGFLRGN